VPEFSAIRDFEASRTNQVFLYEGIQFEGAFEHRDYYTLSVLNGAVGESMSSRLFQGLREERGLCYSVYSSFALGRKACLWLASASSSAKLFPSLFSSLEAELGRLSDPAESLSEEEISESVSRIAGSFDVALDDPEYRMKRIARQQMYDGSALDEDETRALILAVDKRAVDAMTQRLFSGSERARFAFGASSTRVRNSLLSHEGKKHG